MKVFFINPPFKAEFGKFSRESRSPCITKSGALYYPLWLIYAAALVEKNGFDIEFLDAPATPLDEKRSLEFIAQKCDGVKLFVLDTSTPSIYSDVNFGAKLKDIYPEAFVLLVGTHPSAVPEETLAINNKIDAVARHEFDYTVLNLAKCLRDNGELSSVMGLSYVDNGEYIHNPDAGFIDNLDDIPFASEFIKKHLNYRDYFFAASAYPEIQIFTGRGCPARCNFCVYPQTMHGHRYRLRSAQNIIAELKFISKEFYDVKEIVIEDDTFTANKNRVIEICKLMIQEGLHKRFRWLCNARVNLDLETMKLMRVAGCRLIIPGIESTNQQILNNIHKGTNVGEIKAYIANAKKAGLLIHACYMVGNAGETRETMLKTLKDAISFNTDTAQFFPLIPYPGTEAYKWAKANGYINGKYNEYCKEDGTLNCVLNLPGLSSEDLVEFCDFARRKYYLRCHYIFKKLIQCLTNIDDFVRTFKAFSKFWRYLLK